MDGPSKAILWIGVAVIGVYFLQSAGVFNSLIKGKPVGAAASGMVPVGAVGFGPVPNNQTSANIGAVGAGIGAAASGISDLVSSFSGN